MSDSTIYAVVDLETTGTNPKKDKIIQIGCVFIQAGQIIETYAVKLNPGIKIPPVIENLTGISNDSVIDAPYFEDVAADIQQRLANKVFVAHNVHFDFRFLTEAMQQAGYQLIVRGAIDTVELSQVFFPTLPSFRLSDLSRHFGFEHLQPHQADSDALATARLFLAIQERIFSLPLVTIEEIVKHPTIFTMETAEFLTSLLHCRQKNVGKLGADYKIVNGLALQKKVASELPTFNGEEYPEKKEQKAARFKNKVDYRQAQVEEMDLLYHFFTQQSSKSIAIEAGMGSGKTLGYLYPLSFLATVENPVVISTQSILLQHQLLTKDIRLLNLLRPNSLVATIVKSPRHFIQLDRFFASLQKEQHNKQWGLYQLRVLVWLTMTKTGDLTELNINDKEHSFFKEIQHHGELDVFPDSPWAEEDFWLQLQWQVKRSNVLIVNHSYLLEEEQRITYSLPKSDFLIIDEAQELLEVNRQRTTKYWSEITIRHLLQVSRGEYLSDNDYLLLTELQKDPIWCYETRAFQQAILDVSLYLSDLKEDLYEFITLDKQQPADQDFFISAVPFPDFPLYLQKNQQACQLLLNECKVLQQKLQSIYEDNRAKWLPKEQLLLTDWLAQLTKISQFSEEYQAFWSPCLQTKIASVCFDGKERFFSASYTDFAANQVASSAWYRRYQQVAFLGASLSFDGKGEDFSQALGLAKLNFHVLPNMYDYHQQLRLFVPAESAEFQLNNQKEYSQSIAKLLVELVQSGKHSILVLFTAKSLLQEVYRQLMPDYEKRLIEVYAQGISGSKEKIIRRFAHSQGSILLGTTSFFEGVDFPGNQLQIVVLTRLPFDPPERPKVKAYYQYLREQGMDPFSEYALPKASLKIKQAMGRLIRTETDKGVMIMLDQRFLSASYAKRLQASLPLQQPILQLSWPELVQQTNQFLSDEK